MLDEYQHIFFSICDKMSELKFGYFSTKYFRQSQPLSTFVYLCTHLNYTSMWFYIYFRISVSCIACFAISFSKIISLLLHISQQSVIHYVALVVFCFHIPIFIALRHLLALFNDICSNFIFLFEASHTWRNRMDYSINGKNYYVNPILFNPEQPTSIMLDIYYNFI